MSFVPDPFQPTSTATVDVDDHVLALVTARAWSSVGYRDRLAADPAGVLAEAGFQLDPALELRVLIDTPGVRHVALTRQTDDAELVSAHLAGLLPVPRDTEIRVVQSDDIVRHLVIAEPPLGLDATLEAEFALLSKNPADTANVKTNVEVVAEEAEAAVTTSEVAAEAFAVVVLT